MNFCFLDKKSCTYYYQYGTDGLLSLLCTVNNGLQLKIYMLRLVSLDRETENKSELGLYCGSLMPAMVRNIVFDNCLMKGNIFDKIFPLTSNFAFLSVINCTSFAKYIALLNSQRLPYANQLICQALRSSQIGQLVGQSKVSSQKPKKQLNFGIICCFRQAISLQAQNLSFKSLQKMQTIYFPTVIPKVGTIIFNIFLKSQFSFKNISHSSRSPGSSSSFQIVRFSISLNPPNQNGTPSKINVFLKPYSLSYFQTKQSSRNLIDACFNFQIFSQ